MNDRSTGEESTWQPPETPEAVVEDLYDAISFAAGGRPDWDRVRRLFFPDARLVLPNMPGVEGVYSRTVEEWIADFETGREQFADRGFHETQIASRTERFRDMAHVLSSYASRFDANAPDPVVRGLNSFQLVRREGRWWIVHVLWDVEGEGWELPAEWGGG